ncbi:hypothetical protein HGRIS_008174 [Hohenbuehelia grisea]|uniref:VHS domain-containing protein n=1 Tax=Hohenbuehelia grisea TaxID=104357 RepID=A0ABR3J7C8_9AGAR
MSALSFAKQAFSREKPHSSITDWVEILTSKNYAEEAYDGIPELVDAINLQGAGPTEASRALRKKLKHGNPHQQYRAVVLLKALVENCGHKFQTTFADDHLTDALKHLTSDPDGDAKVKKKTLMVLAAWEHQYKAEPGMAHIAGLYKQCKQHRVTNRENIERLNESLGVYDSSAQRKKEKREAKEKERQKKEDERAARQAERERAQQQQRRRQPFDFEKEKPKVLSSIVEASQASSNLINAITLVNPEKESLQTNERVQECLEKAKLARKPIVRYIQLVENEELIGTLIETNERIIGALEMYDQLAVAGAPRPAGPTEESLSQGLAATHITGSSEINQLQERQRAEIERARSGGANTGDESGNVHPDLQDLSFGPLGGSTNNLPTPLRPTSARSDDYEEAEPYDARGSLSDFSDYESSDEETHNAAGGSSSRRRDYVSVSDDPDEDVAVAITQKVKQEEADPFADPFADEVAIGPKR